MRLFKNTTSDLADAQPSGPAHDGPFHAPRRRHDHDLRVDGLHPHGRRGGIAIDIMRYETQRVQLQYTLDRSVLAAASVTQPLNPVDVVENYFEISGLQNYRLSVDVEEGLNFRRVEAYAELEVQHAFHAHVRRARPDLTGRRCRRRGDPERRSVPVLDISGSMGWGSKMTNMQTAARDFVTEMLQANENGHGNLVSISIIPYNGMVNLGEPLESVFTLSDEHTESSCVRFTDEQYTRTNVDIGEEIERIAHWDFDDYFQYDDFDSPTARPTSTARSCPSNMTKTSCTTSSTT
jgi:hypothetical protein